jgi:hypothetical protein
MRYSEVPLVLGRLLNYQGQAFRGFRLQETATPRGWGVPGVVYRRNAGRWAKITAHVDDLSLAPVRTRQAAIESLTWMAVNETIGHRLHRGDMVVSDELDMVCLASEEERPEGAVVATRKARSEVLVAWLVQPHRRRR